jgi:hypothetical protein
LTFVSLSLQCHSSSTISDAIKAFMFFIYNFVS